MLIDSLDQLLATLVGERRYLKDRPLVAEPPDEVLDAPRPGIGVDHVQFVQHEPTRLGVELGIVFLEFGRDGARLHNRVDTFVKGAMSTMCSSRRVR